jgi:hypothetical protein
MGSLLLTGAGPVTEGTCEGCSLRSEDCGYGCFHGGDPRLFSPDPECSTEKEREAHREACAAWERGERPTFPVSGFETTEKDETFTDKRDGSTVKIPAGSAVHVLRSSFGLGGYTYYTCPLFQDGGMVPPEACLLARRAAEDAGRAVRAWEWLTKRPWLSVCVGNEARAKGEKGRQLFGVLSSIEGDGWSVFPKYDTPLAAVEAAMKEDGHGK